jgi:hypothetical protein
MAGAPIQQIVLFRHAAMQDLARGRLGGSAVYDAVPEAGIWPGAVWRGPTTPTAELYELRDPSGVCHADPLARVWGPVGSYSGGWVREDRAGSGAPRRFELRPQEAVAQLPPGKTYLLVATQRRDGVDSPNPADDWMRRWSFNASTAPAVLAAKPAFFPTLDLAETAGLLEESLNEANSARRGRIGGFAAIVRADG